MGKSLRRIVVLFTYISCTRCKAVSASRGPRRHSSLKTRTASNIRTRCHLSKRRASGAFFCLFHSIPETGAGPTGCHNRAHGITDCFAGLAAGWADRRHRRRRWPDLAARVLKLGLSKNRNSPALWTGLGNAFVAHDRGFLSPSAEFAYNKALRLTPGFPGALYFYAVALAENGRIDEARPLFVSLVASMPPNMPIRAQLLADLEKMGVLKQGAADPAVPVK